MTAQELLTITAESLVIGSIALYSYLFAVGLMARHRHVSPGQLSIFDVQPEPEQPEPPAPEQPRYEVVILPFVRPSRKTEQPQEIDLSGFSIRQLKAIASAVKLPRYNVEPKANLQARLLAEVPHDRLMQAMQAIAA